MGQEFDLEFLSELTALDQTIDELLSGPIVYWAMGMIEEHKKVMKRRTSIIVSC